MKEFELLTKVIEELTGITTEQLVSKKRVRHLVEMRMIYSTIMKASSEGFSLEYIGALINRGHDTIIYYLKIHELLMEQKNAKYKTLFELINENYLQKLYSTNDDMKWQLIQQKLMLEKSLEKVNKLLKDIEIKTTVDELVA